MRSNSRTITVSYDQACLHDELFKENMAFQQCSDGDECKHFGPEKRTSAPQPQAGSFGGYGAVDTTRKKQTSRKRTVSFSPATCKVIHIDHQTEGLEHELWYSQSDFVFFEDQAWQCVKRYKSAPLEAPSTVILVISLGSKRCFFVRAILIEEMH